MSNFTPNLRLTQPIAGETGWGDKVNNGITALVESALTGITTVNLTNGDYTMSVANGDADESRSMFLQITGTATVVRNLNCPAVPKLYFVRNLSSHLAIVRTQSGLGVEVPTGRAMVVQCDGVDVLPAIDYLPVQTFLHNQSVPSTTWNLQHNLNKYPAVTITDLQGYEVEALVRHTSLDALTITFNQPFAGNACLT